jgi:signal transduction histidine kinase
MVRAIMDITARRKLEEELRYSQKMEAVGRLAGGIAHDFNNLLTIILGYGSLLKQSLQFNEQAEDHIRVVMGAAGQAARLTQQLLAFSRKQVLRPEVINLNDVIGEMEKILRGVVREDTELIITLAPDLGRVRADRGQIEQVVMNLCVNARDAMPRGGRLTLETGNIDLAQERAAHNGPVKPGPYALLAISDTGSGMDAETRARIFEPFFTTKEFGKGTGLGLSTCHGIVKQSGGDILVYSEPGQGSRFEVYLPRSVETQAPSPRPELARGANGD